MPTKIKTTNNTRGRPKKGFVSKKKTDSNIKRGRGRPRKQEKISTNDSINTKISKHSQDIKKITQKQKKIQLDIKNTTFSNKKIKKKDDNRTDRFALGLLIFSMLLFIFSLYKTFYLNPSLNKNNSNIDIENNIDQELHIDTGSTIIKDVSKQETLSEQQFDNNLNFNIENGENIKSIKTNNISELISDEDVIKMFYKTINDKQYDELPVFADNYLKFSSLFKIYYAQRRLGNFLSNLTNEKIYITHIKYIENETTKPNVKYYNYTLKYKLKNNNKLFSEQWKIAIVDRNGKKVIGKMQCINTGCSKMPFFNPERHGIK